MKTKPTLLRAKQNGSATTSVRRIRRQVESGEVMSIGWVLVKRGGYITTGWDAQGEDGHKMLAGAQLLSYRLAKSLDDGAE